ELHRALEVGEEHAHLLALALDGRTRRHDAIGEVLRGIALRGDEAVRGLGPGQRRAALPAELLVGPHGGAAARAGHVEADPALLAEAHALAVLRLAARAAHRQLLPSARRALRGTGTSARPPSPARGSSRRAPRRWRRSRSRPRPARRAARG